MQSITTTHGTVIEWDDTFKPGDLITLSWVNGYFEFISYLPPTNAGPLPPNISCRQLYNKNGKKYTGQPFNAIAVAAARASSKLEKEIAKNIQAAAVFNKLLEADNFKRSIDK